MMESCSDGPNSAGCDAQCHRIPVCGDGILDSPEEDCEGTNLNVNQCNTIGFESGTLSCKSDCSFETSSCVAPICGNASFDIGEICEDGNTTNGDGCSQTCTVEGVEFNETEPNNSFDTANGPFNLAAENFVIAGRLNLLPGFRENSDVYSFTNLSAAPIRIELAVLDSSGVVRYRPGHIR